MSTCGTCWKVFPSGRRARNQHFDASGHWKPPYECDSCDRYFDSETAMAQHMNSTAHWVQDSSSSEEWILCDYCPDQFSTDAEMVQHEADAHNRCKPCDRGFESRNNLRMHHNSKIHNPSTINCPFCSKACNTATGLVHHLERGACPNAPLDRIKMYEAVRQRDPDGILAKKLLTWESTPTTYEATDLAWDSAVGAWMCYFCQRPFAQRQHLNQHLSSPVHQQSLYHCMNSGCRKEFKTLAAVIHHLESESCGYMRFQTVQKYVSNVVTPGRRITYN